MSHGHNTDEISRNLELIGLTNYHYYVFTVVGSAWVSDML